MAHISGWSTLAAYLEELSLGATWSANAQYCRRLPSQTLWRQLIRDARQGLIEPLLFFAESAYHAGLGEGPMGERVTEELIRDRQRCGYGQRSDLLHGVLIDYQVGLYEVRRGDALCEGGLERRLEQWVSWGCLNQARTLLLAGQAAANSDAVDYLQDDPLNLATSNNELRRFEFAITGLAGRIRRKIGTKHSPSWLPRRQDTGEVDPFAPQVQRHESELLASMAN